jgi:hypothetical protein
MRMEAVKARARAKRVSVSQYLAELVREHAANPSKQGRLERRKTL